MSKSQKTTDISSIIKKRRERLIIRKGYRNLLIGIIVILLLGYLLFSQVVIVAQGKGMSMFPSIRDGDLTLGFRLEKDYRRGDVIIYELDNERHIGRIVAEQGDLVSIDEFGTILVNGVIQAGEIMYPTYPKEAISYPYEVAENSIFILGDYRSQSRDSRDFGQIPVGDVEGKIITILRRRGI